jgi:rod shape determining protein RodA
MIKDKDTFSSFVAMAAFAIIFAHFFINIAMSVGLLPIIGIPLAFVSYGGTSLLINTFLLASVLNIYKNRKYYS